MATCCRSTFSLSSATFMRLTSSVNAAPAPSASPDSAKLSVKSRSSNWISSSPNPSLSPAPAPAPPAPRPDMVCKPVLATEGLRSHPTRYLGRRLRGHSEAGYTLKRASCTAAAFYVSLQPAAQRRSQLTSFGAKPTRKRTIRFDLIRAILGKFTFCAVDAAQHAPVQSHTVNACRQVHNVREAPARPCRGSRVRQRHRVPESGRGKPLNIECACRSHTHLAMLFRRVPLSACQVGWRGRLPRVPRHRLVGRVYLPGGGGNVLCLPLRRHRSTVREFGGGVAGRGDVGVPFLQVSHVRVQQRSHALPRTA